MNHSIKNLTAIPTNIITGFLGVGKTSTILNLLHSKPMNERWAVLVNEFGEIGIDGSLFQGLKREEQNVHIREVPGGCMCCTAGLPMKTALNQLIARAKPDHLFIEPTGLGHPIEVLESLSDPCYQNVLSIQKTVTLVDARKLYDSRYTEHVTFNQQIAIADVIVGNKLDLYEPQHKKKLKEYVESKISDKVDIIFTKQGQFSIELLNGSSAFLKKVHQHHDHNHETVNTGITMEDSTMPESGFIKAINHGEGFKSVGWRFQASKIFNRKKIVSFLNRITAERMKAVFITDAGIYGYNLTVDQLTEVKLKYGQESRIEIIADSIADHWDEQLMACINLQ